MAAWERDLRRTWAREHDVAVELRFLDAPIEVLTARVEARNRTLPDRAPRLARRPAADADSDPDNAHAGGR